MKIKKVIACIDVHTACACIYLPSHPLPPNWVAWREERPLMFLQGLTSPEVCIIWAPLPSAQGEAVCIWCTAAPRPSPGPTQSGLFSVCRVNDVTGHNSAGPCLPLAPAAPQPKWVGDGAAPQSHGSALQGPSQAARGLESWAQGQQETACCPCGIPGGTSINTVIFSND